MKTASGPGPGRPPLDPEGQETLAVRVPRKIADALDVRATEDGKTRSEVVRSILAWALGVHWPPR
jgi:hypothetical protein